MGRTRTNASESGDGSLSGLSLGLVHSGEEGVGGLRDGGGGETSDETGSKVVSGLLSTGELSGLLVGEGAELLEGNLVDGEPEGKRRSDELERRVERGGDDELTWPSGGRERRAEVSSSRRERRQTQRKRTNGVRNLLKQDGSESEGERAVQRRSASSFLPLRPLLRARTHPA